MSTIGRPFGKYTLLANIATGGMAEVVLALMHGAAGFEKLVVIKRLIDRLAGDPQYVEMFLDEAKIAARLSHSNIVQVLELGQVDGQYFIAMEFLAGLNLSTLTKKAASRTQGLPQDLVAVLLAQACAGLHYAHERHLPDGRALDIIHRDVTPHNLVVTYEGLLKIVDFGIAKAADRMTKTRSGTIKGKFAYMSPEQCRNDPLDRRSDVFALGICFWETLTGKRLFRREGTYQTYEAILKGDIPAPSSVRPGIDAEFDRIALRALERDLARRYPSAEAMQDELEEQLHRRAAMGVGGILTRTDVANFLERHFADEIRKQREFIAKLTRGEVQGPAPAAEAYPPLDEGPDEDAPTRLFEQPEGRGGLHASAPAPSERAEEISVGSADIVAAPTEQSDAQSVPTIVDPPPEAGSSPALPAGGWLPAATPPAGMPITGPLRQDLIVTDKLERPPDLRPKSHGWLWLLLLGAAAALMWWISRS